jgi:hypothetical protein
LFPLLFSFTEAWKEYFYSTILHRKHPQGNFLMVIVMEGTWVFAKTHYILCLKCMQFTTCKLYFNKDYCQTFKSESVQNWF